MYFAANLQRGKEEGRKQEQSGEYGQRNEISEIDQINKREKTI